MVKPSATGNAPPRKLGQHGLALWNAIDREYDIVDRGGIEILARVCAANDRVEALAAQINDDGETVRSRTGVLKGHPCLKDELALRAFICRGLERLGLNIESIKSVGRPAGWSADDAE